MGYRKEAIKGVSWIISLRACVKAVSFLKTIILARILLPSQFGAYGIAMLVLSFLEVITETGVNVVLIQEKKTDAYIDSAWIVSIVRGSIIMFLIILFTPLIAHFFNSEESTMLLYAISLVPFLRGFINPSIVKFQKHLRFQVEFWYRFSIFIVDSTIAIFFSLLTQHPIGIVIGLIAGVLLEIVLSHTIVKPGPTFRFQREYLRTIIHKGKWITASGMFNYLFHNADNMVVGKLLGSASLGLYQMAYSLSILPITEIADVFSRVTFPIFAKISTDKKRLRNAFLKTIIATSLLTVPFGLLLYLFPREIIAFILGEKWIFISSILPILAVFGIIRAISGFTSVLFLAVGKQKYVTMVTLLSTVGLLIPIVPLVQHYGMKGAAISALIGSVAALPVMVYYTWKVFNNFNEKS